MCNFFSFVTDPINHPSEYYFLDWEYRKANLKAGGADSHSHICKTFNLREDVCNKYELNPLTKEFTVDQINSKRDDSKAAEKWANRLDFKEIVEPLIIKQIVNPFEMPKVEKPTEEQIGWLKDWASVRVSVWNSVGVSVGDTVRASVGDTVEASVRASVRASVGDTVRASVGDTVRVSVWNSVWAYTSTFFSIEYKYDFSSAAKLWEAGLVPSFDGTTWRLHSGVNTDIVYEWNP